MAGNNKNNSNSSKQTPNQGKTQTNSGNTKGSGKAVNIALSENAKKGISSDTRISKPKK